MVARPFNLSLDVVLLNYVLDRQTDDADLLHVQLVIGRTAMILRTV